MAGEADDLASCIIWIIILNVFSVVLFVIFGLIAIFWQYIVIGIVLVALILIIATIINKSKNKSSKKNSKISPNPTTTSKQSESKKSVIKEIKKRYIYCKKCNGYYVLQTEETPEDFDKCECGGELEYYEPSIILKPDEKKKICNSCGTTNPENYHFCLECGKKFIK